MSFKKNTTFNLRLHFYLLYEKEFIKAISSAALRICIYIIIQKYKIGVIIRQKTGRLNPSILSTQKFQIVSKKGVFFSSHATGSSVIGMLLVPAVMLTGNFKIRLDGKKKPEVKKIS